MPVKYHSDQFKVIRTGYPPVIKGDDYNEAVCKILGPYGKLINLQMIDKRGASGYYEETWVMAWSEDRPDFADGEVALELDGNCVT